MKTRDNSNNGLFYQLGAQILYFNTLITRTSLYMFRALLCSSSGGQICISTASGLVTLFRLLFSTGLFISPSGISELDCATTKTDKAERSISIGRESLQVFFFVLGALAYLQVPPLWGSREEKWRS